jgi:hypothetical protein
VKVKIVLDVDREDREALADNYGVPLSKVNHAFIRSVVRDAFTGFIEDCQPPDGGQPA